jgi:hypothetical protein
MKIRFLLCSPLFALSALATPLDAQTTVSVPCNLDNTLYEDPAGALSNGSGIGIIVGRPSGGLVRRGLLRFDVASAVPAGARILDARLSVNVFSSPNTSPLNVTGHRVLQAWGEGTSVSGGGGGMGAPSTPNDATWIHTFFPGSFWTAAGGDFVPAPSFTMLTQATGVATAPIAAAAIADVQLWLDNPGQNFGWLLKMVDETLTPSARRIDSRESTGTRPVLSVTFAVAGTAGVFGTGCAVGSGTFGLALVGTPVGGSPIQLVQSNGPAGQFGANFFSTGLDPVGLMMAQACSLYLPPAQGIVTGSGFLLDGAGAGSSLFTVPAGYPGILIFIQSAAIDSTPLGFALSNAGFIDLP